MSYTSPRGGRRYFTSSALGAQRAVSPFSVRDALANNLMHLADQAHSKVLVNDMSVNGSILTGNAGPTADIASAGTGEFYVVQVYGPFDLSVFAYEGERVAYQVSVDIYATAAHWTWGAKLCLPDETTSSDGGIGAFVPPDDCMLFTSVAGPAWLAHGGYSIKPTRGLIDRARAGVRTLDGIGGSEAYVYTTSVCLQIVAKGTSTDTLYGCHAREFLVLP